MRARKNRICIYIFSNIDDIDDIVCVCVCVCVCVRVCVCVCI